MRDEVLIKRQLVAMVTWILANKRVGEKCLLGDGKKEGNRRKEGRRQTELKTVPGQTLHLVFLPESKKKRLR